MAKNLVPFLLLTALVVGIFAFYKYQQINNQKQPESGSPTSQSTPPPKPDFLIILVGDSMTQYLGNSTELRQYLKEYYPDKTLDIYNYGFGSTNILSVPARLTGWTNVDRPYQPILDIDSDIIIIESFGHNPLSQYPREEGLRKQEETLDEIVRLIRDRRPNVQIVFMTTISPNSKTYARSAADLSPETRKEWVEERIAYIKNHAEYAKSHNIPLINVFEKSLDKTGDGNLDYIEKQNYIHPSPSGIVFISHEIADFIYKNSLLN